MLIGIDASRGNKPNKTGTEWYSWYLIEELKKISRPADKFLLYTNFPLTGELGQMPPNWQEKVLAWPPKYLWTQIRLWWELLLNPPDVLLVPAHTIPLLPIRRKTKVLATVHDVGFKRFPELYKPIQVRYHDLTMQRIKKRADLIITISEFSKQEIIDLYGVKPEKIKVVYLGFDPQKFELKAESAGTELVPFETELLSKYKIAQPYLLYIGRLEKKKNIANIVAAFVKVRHELENEARGGLKLVLAGGGGNQFEEIKNIIATQKLETEVIITGYVAEEDLPALYRGAEIFLFPTLYEGFGLPILESMACGTPVVASDQNPHREVGGEAALYADSYSPEALADAIMSILNDANLRQSLIEKGLARAKEFSWAKTAEEIYKIIVDFNRL